MAVRKLKPVRTPRTLDSLAEARETIRAETMRTSQAVVERSKRLVEESKEIMANMQPPRKKRLKRRTR
jgi:hypothetical protein